MDYINHNHTTDFSGIDEDMKLRIHYMEKEAYSYLLRAFIAQSDLLSWDKEGLITELRKELNVSDTEHGELLVEINSDQSIKMIREWRKGAHHAQESFSGKVNTPRFAPNSAGNAPQTIVKPSHASDPKSQKYISHGQPYPGTQSWKYVPHIQPSSGTHSFPVPAQFRDAQHSGDLARFHPGNPEQSTRVVSHNNQSPADSKRKGSGKSQPKKGFHAPDGKKRSDVIEILITDQVIKKVEQTIYGTKHPSSVQVEKAKSFLSEHERSILEALDKLADVSDGDDSPSGMQHHSTHKEHPRNGQVMAVHSEIYRQRDDSPSGMKHHYTQKVHPQTGQVMAAHSEFYRQRDDSPSGMKHHYTQKVHPQTGRVMAAHSESYRKTGGSHGYHSEGFVVQTQATHPGRLRVPYIHVQDDEDTL